MKVGFLSILIETLHTSWLNKLRFTLDYGCYVPVFARQYTKAYRGYTRAFTGECDEREAAVRHLLLNAFNHLLVSSQLLVQSLFVPSGNLMRHFSESISSAILFSCKDLDHFDRYRRYKKDFRFDRIVKDLDCKAIQNRIGLDKDGVRNALKIHRFYHLYSHTTAFSLGLIMNLSRRSRIFLGATYDAARKVAYQVEIKRRISACELLENVIELTRIQLRTVEAQRRKA